MASPWKHPKTGVYYVRISVPKEVRAVLGKTEFKESLGTKNLTEAKAPFAKRQAEIYKIIEAARNKNAGILDTLVSKDIYTLAEQWLATEQECYDETGDYSALLIEIPSSNTEISTTETVTAFEVVALDAIQAANHSDNYKPLGRLFAHSVNGLLATNGLTVDASSDAYKNLLMAVAKRYQKLCELAKKRESGDWDSKLEVKATTTLVALPDKPARTQHPSISKVYEMYAEHTALKNPDSNKLDDYLSSVNLFISLVGDVSIDLVTKYQVNEFKDLLYKLPKTQSRDIKSLSMSEQVKLGESRGMERLSANTVRNKFNHVRALFTFATVDKLILNSNPFEQVRPPGRLVKHAKAQKEFTKEELRRIFSTPLFTREEFSPFKRADYGQTLFWLPLLMYYTGARPKELLQLQRKNLKSVMFTNDESGDARQVYTLMVTDEDGSHGQTTKTATSYRELPIHYDLIKLGFWEYVSRFKDRESIWPTMREDQSVSQYRMNFAKKWKAYIQEHAGIDSEAKPLYGYRHGLKSAFRDIGIDSNVHNAITGHAGGGVGDKYGKVWLETAVKAIDKFPSVPNLKSIIAPHPEC